MTGLCAIFRKELSDHFSSYRFVILFALIAMVSFITSYMAGMQLSDNLEALSKTRFPYLMLFSTPGAVFSMVQFVAFFGPLIGLVLGFDSINRERAHGTLIKIVSQPIFRDAVINGKFLAGVVTILVMLVAIVMVITGFGLSIVGIVPTFEEIWRIAVYLIMSVFYISLWLGVSILFSIAFRSIATSALASVALWIFLSFFVTLGAEAVADSIAPIEKQDVQAETIMRNVRIKEGLSLLSPMVLYSEATTTIIDPMRKTTGTMLFMTPLQQILSSRFQNPLSLSQSLIVVFPHVTALIALTLICFAVSYILFMLQEIRS